MAIALGALSIQWDAFDNELRWSVCGHAADGALRRARRWFFAVSAKGTPNRSSPSVVCVHIRNRLLDERVSTALATRRRHRPSG